MLTSWNGLMIAGLADVGRVTKDQRYIDAATKAAKFVLERLRSKEGRLLASYSGGQAKLNGYVTDYAFWSNGLLALHRATGDAQWLTDAQQLTDKQIELFWDEKQHGFYFTSDDHESLLARAKDFVDTAQPSGNSVTAQNLLYLGRALKRNDYREKAQQTIEAAWPQMERSPSIAPRMAVAAAELLSGEDQN